MADEIGKKDLSKKEPEPVVKLESGKIAKIHTQTLSSMIQFLGISDPGVIKVLNKMVDVHVEELITYIKSTNTPIDVS
jgi:hypothetical protein